MPLSPNALLTTLDTEDRALYDTLVAEIDKELKKNFNGSKLTIVSISKYPNSRVQIKIQSAYLRAGWHGVKFEDSQIDGPWVELEWNAHPVNTMERD
jgi:hypothetical protein